MVLGSSYPALSARLWIFLALLAACAPAARAESLIFDAKLSERGEWDSNPSMLTHHAKALYGSTTVPELSVKSETPTSLLAGQVSLTENLFNRDTYNSTDFHASADVNKRTERWGAGLRLATSYDTTRTSELVTFGNQALTTRHFSYSLQPDFSFTPTPRNVLTLAPSFEKHVYDSDAYTGYAIAGLTPGYERRLTPLTSAVLQMQMQRYQSDQAPKRRTDSLSPSAGFATALTPDIQLRVTAGAQASKERGQTVVQTGWQWKPVYEASLSYKNEQNDVTFKASRARQAFSNGSDALLTILTLDDRHKLNESFTLTGSVSYRYANNTASSGSDLDSAFSGQAGLAYRLTGHVDFTTDYRYRREKLTGEADAATGHLARAGFVLHSE